MEKFYEQELEALKDTLIGATIVNVEHYEKADEGMVLKLNTGIEIAFGWGGGYGICKILNNHLPLNTKTQ